MTTVFADEYGYSAGDATSALQAAIDDPNADRIVVRNTGNPWLISEQIELKSNKEIVFEEGVVVQAKPGSFLANDRAMFVGLNIENIKLIGQGSGSNKATLKMNKEEYNSNQFGHVVSLLGVDGYEVSGLTLTGGGGDGLHLAGGAFGRPDPNVLFYSANGLVENITSDNNRRQGLSIDSAKNLVVRNSTFTNTSGTDPSAGINLEPTWDFESLENVRIENVDISGNAGNGIQMGLGNLDNTSPPISVDFNNVTLNDSKINAIFITGKYLAGVIDPSAEFGDEFKGEPNQNSPNADINGTINFDNINISNAGAIASGNGGNNPDVYVFVEGISGDQGDPNNLAINFNNLNINDPLDTTVRTTPIFIQGLGGDNNPQEIGNLSFNGVTIQGNYSTDVVRADLGRDDGNLNNVSGDITVFNPNGTGVFIDNADRAENFNLNITQGNGETPAVSNISPAVVEPAVEEAITEEVVTEPVEPAIVLEGDEPVVEELIEPAVEAVIVEEVVIEPVEPAIVLEGDEPVVEELIEPAVEAVIVEEVVIEPVESAIVLEGDEPVVEEIIAEEVVIEPVEPAIVLEGDEPVVEEIIAEEVVIEPVEPVIVLEDGEPVVEELIEPAVLFEGGETGSVQIIEPVAEAIAEDRFSTDFAEATLPTTELEPQSIDESIPVTDVPLGEGGEGGNLTSFSADTEADSSFTSVFAENSDENLAPEAALVTEPDTGSIPIQNPSFTDSLTGWNPTGSDVSVVERSPNDRWARIDSFVGGISQDVTDKIAAGQDYQVSATTSLSESTNRGYIGVRFTNSSGELLNLQNTPVVGNGIEETQVNFTAPDEFTQAEIFAFKNDGSGTLFVDDFSLTE